MTSSAYLPFHSRNLLYRAAETPTDDALFQTLQKSPSWQNSSVRAQHPPSRETALDYLNQVRTFLLGVIICLQPPSSSPSSSDPEPIGVIFLRQPLYPHRFSELGIDILEAYQGKGYGSEAIRWALRWAFETAGLHRVCVRAFEWNEGARKLYARLGFREEGRDREELWFRGRWWDGCRFGILEGEWREMIGRGKEGEESRVRKE